MKEINPAVIFFQKISYNISLSAARKNENASPSTWKKKKNLSSVYILVVSERFELGGGSRRG